MSAPPKTAFDRSNWILILGWIAALALGLALSMRLVLQIDRPTEFQSYFTAAHLVAEGQPIERFYDTAWFREQTNRLVPGHREAFTPNAPTTAVLYAPLALFRSYIAARFVWLALSLLLLVWFIEALIRIAAADSVTRPFWYVAILVAEPVRANLAQGQAYIVVGVALILALRFWQRNRDISAGATLAGLFAYKSAGAAIWPVAVAAGRWRLVLSGIVLLIAIVMVTWVMIGSSGWLAYLNELRDMSAGPGMRSTAYQSMESIIRHLLSEQGTRGAPVVALPIIIARSIAMGIALLLLAVTMYGAHKNPDDELVVGAAILLTLVIIPVSTAHFYISALIPIAQLVRRLGGRLVEWKGLALWIGGAIILLPLPNRLLQLVDGWAALLAYPKLYGALLLWAVCMSLIMDRASLRQSPLSARRTADLTA